MAARTVGATLAALTMTATMASCSPAPATSSGTRDTALAVTDAPTTPPDRRAVVIETTACGFADGATGSGVIVDDGLLVTVAHVVIAASMIDVELPDGSHREGRIVALDTSSDLAVVAIDRADVSPAEFGSGSADETGLLIGGARSGTAPITVVRKVVLEIEEVRGTARYKRQGFEIAAQTGTGDSGAGIYNDGDELIGIVFATSTADTSITWATDISELVAVMASIDRRAIYACDPGASKVVEQR